MSPATAKSKKKKEAVEEVDAPIEKENDVPKETSPLASPVQKKKKSKKIAQEPEEQDAHMSSEEEAPLTQEASPVKKSLKKNKRRAVLDSSSEEEVEASPVKTPSPKAKEQPPKKKAVRTHFLLPFVLFESVFCYCFWEKRPVVRRIVKCKILVHIYSFRASQCNRSKFYTQTKWPWHTCKIKKL